MACPCAPCSSCLCTAFGIPRRVLVQVLPLSVLAPVLPLACSRLRVRVLRSRLASSMLSRCSLATLDVLLAAVGYSELWSLLASALPVAGGLLVCKGALAAWLGLRWLPMLGALRLASPLPRGLRAMLGVSLAAVVCSALWPPLGGVALQSVGRWSSV